MKKVTIFSLALSLALALPAFSQNAGGPAFAIGTNAAYLALSAISTGSKSVMAVLPVECQFALSPSWALQPEAIVIYSWSASSGGAGQATFVGTCGIAWRPQGLGLRGWYLAAGPGLAYATDSSHLLALANAEGGYQWILGKGLLLGAGAGGRFILDLTSGGFLSMPDLKLNIGWAF